MRLFLAILMLLALAAPARAGFAMCNKTAHPAKVALGRFNGTDWGSEGWWTIAPGKCETLVPGALDARYYYLYAGDGGSGTWDGTHGFCVAASERFAIVGREDCSGRGYERKGFYEVDTHDDSNVVKSLSD